jgi:hypothetical protein
MRVAVLTLDDQKLALDVLTSVCSCALLCGSTRRSLPTTPHTGAAAVTEETTTLANKACTRSVSAASSVYVLHPATCLTAGRRARCTGVLCQTTRPCADCGWRKNGACFLVMMWNALCAIRTTDTWRRATNRSTRQCRRRPGEEALKATHCMRELIQRVLRRQHSVGLSLNHRWPQLPRATAHPELIIFGRLLSNTGQAQALVWSHLRKVVASVMWYRCGCTRNHRIKASSRASHYHTRKQCRLAEREGLWGGEGWGRECRV